MNIEYKGVWPTVIAAFDTEGHLDIEANKSITEYLINKGSDGLFAVCQSSEMFFLTLDEKVALAQSVVETADGRVPVIASGHTSDTIEKQIEELKAVSETGVDAVVLVSNRLAAEGEGTDVFLKNLQIILEAMPDVNFGIYECPYPYRRLLSSEELKWCADSGRIVFLKDVSCDTATEKERAKIVKNSDLKLFNANTETLMDSLEFGYHGYNGVMGNFHIDIYKWLFENHRSAPEKARKVQASLTHQSEIEKFAYPVNAKKHMMAHGVKMTPVSRRLSADSFDDEAKNRLETLLEWERNTREMLNI
ncbi:dihydrodipicolinate synthase family protein [Fusibacter sp. JL216-2]|uniref:dihydrodipicolinate synthase family protein n=1 Tax=Fusibacter sp. JL216-2 TaxID=3071453 RepID=UPI003D33D6E0